MRTTAKVLFLLAGGVLCSLSSAHGGEAEVTVEKGDRLVLLGDSITQAGAKPGGYVTLVREALEKKYGDSGVEVIGAGISGNKVPDLQQRLARDVLAKKPDIVVIYIGINDVWHSQRGRGTPKDKYEAGLRSLIKRIGEAGAEVILATPSVIGEKTDGTNPLDEMLDEYAQISRNVAEKTGSELLDLRKAFLEHLAKHNEENNPKNVLTTDGVHLNAEGNRFVAGRMLAALGARTSTEPGTMLRHVVLFKFKDDTEQETVEKIEAAFAALPEKIDVIRDFEWGTDVSTEGLAQDFTHCFLVTFADEAGRDAYLPHPAHKEFVELVRPHLDKVMVVDYLVRE